TIMLTKKSTPSLSSHNDNDDQELQPILDSIQYLEIESRKLGHAKIANLLKEAWTQPIAPKSFASSTFEPAHQMQHYLELLNSMKVMQQNLEKAGLTDESEIIKVAVISLFCKFDIQNEALAQLN
ncbi:MAG: hypothetical protein L3J67_12790, partial [Hyphomicrobiaceae bacterium]|nr:hypothetical protein [Hyphomicrobiaceae bacterium]